MIKNFLLKNLFIVHSGTAINKVFAAFKLAAVPAVGLSISEHFMGWYVDNRLFIFFLMLALFADLIVGIWKYMKQSRFSFKKMLLGFIEKLGIIILAYFLTEAFIQILSDANLDSAYFRVATKIMIFIYPAGNAFINMGFITNGKFPPIGFLKRFEKFNNTLDITTFNPKNKIDETENNDIDSSE